MPYLSDPDVTLYHGDVLATLAELPAESVDCVVTSPPYWGLRDYGTGEWEGGDPSHKHETIPARAGRGGSGAPGKQTKDAFPSEYAAAECSCGATRIDKQLGLEPTPEQYVERMVEVFREVRRVLAPHGTVWLNLGDSYAAARSYQVRDNKHTEVGNHMASEIPPGLKQKDLVGIPWRVAFALQADGWYLRSDIIWAKPNPMPESVTDRPTKAHEMVFLLAKGPWIGREPGPIEQRLSKEDARWLALLLDAEGNISIKHTRREGNSDWYGAQIAVGSTSRELLERARELAGAGNVLERKGQNALMFYWQLSNKQAQDFLYAVYPHLIVKRRQAAIAIHLESMLYHRGNATRRTDKENAALESLWLRNKECNQFGSPDLSDVPAPKYGKWGAARYFFDQEAVREAAEWNRWGDQTVKKPQQGTASWIKPKGKNELPRSVPERDRRVAGFNERWDASEENGTAPTGRNIRSVWEIATQPYPEAHFATFPEELARRCIAAGCPEQVCRVCRKARERILERQNESTYARVMREQGTTYQEMKAEAEANGITPGNVGNTHAPGQRGAYYAPTENKQLGWSDCGHSDYRPGITLDPFIGSGTVAYVARELGRHAIGIDLNAQYLELAAKRLQQQSLFAETA